MGKYLALQIIAGRLEYKAVIARYGKYKTVIDGVIEEKGYEIELRGSKDINKQIRHWDFEALSKDFDFKKFLPFN